MEETVKNTIDFLIKGCTCKKGCNSGRCGCKKNGRTCGPGCQCQGCANLAVSVDDDSASGDIHESSEEESSEDESETEMYTTEIVDMDFQDDYQPILP